MVRSILMCAVAERFDILFAKGDYSRAEKIVRKALALSRLNLHLWRNFGCTVC
jgi:hypothetical protein